MLTLTGKVAHNSCDEGSLFYLSSCEIRTDDNSSTRVFTTVKSYWWNSRINNTVLARFNYISHINIFLGDILIIFNEYRCS